MTMRMGRVGLCLMVWILVTVDVAAADAIDEAAKLPPADAVLELETLLEGAESAGDEGAQVRAQAWLSRLRGSPADHVSYGETLVAVARGNLQAQSTAAGVVPYLQDALEALGRVKEEKTLEPGLRARWILARGEALYILRRFEEATAVLKSLDVTAHETAVVDRVLDLLARSQYAAGAHTDAAATFLVMGNELGAAAAYDAARQPEKSVPLYARALQARPTDDATLQRALRGATFAGGEALLLAALEAIPIPAGAAGVPRLLAQADLLEAVSRTAEAVPVLREASDRDPKDPRAPARLGRVLLLTGDVESEDTWDAGAAAYEESLRRDPAHEAASAGLYYIAGRDYKLLWKRWRDPRLRNRCLRIQEALVAAAPEDSLALSNLGNTYRVLGRTADALGAYERAREANPYDPGICSDHGLALSAADRPAEALAAYLESIELDAGHRAGHQNAARALWLQGNDQKAASHLGAAIPSARAVGRSAGTYVFLMGRTWRTTRQPDLR